MSRNELYEEKRPVLVVYFFCDVVEMAELRTGVRDCKGNRAGVGQLGAATLHHKQHEHGKTLQYVQYEMWFDDSLRDATITKAVPNK